jgi:hypothetical protein
MSMEPKVGACPKARCESVSTVAGSSFCGTVAASSFSSSVDPRDRFETMAAISSAMELDTDTDTNFMDVHCEAIMENAGYKTPPASPIGWLPSPAHKASRRARYSASEHNQISPEVATPMETSVAEPCSPPRTPRGQSSMQRSHTPPPLVPKSMMPKPAMLCALMKNSLEQVHAVLKEDPKAVAEPFWQQSVEPPLCCAVRLKCTASIVELLLNYGASPEAQDARGRTPAKILDQLLKPPTNPDMVATLPMFVLPAFPPMIMPPGPSAQQEAWHREVTNLLASRKMGA